MREDLMNQMRDMKIFNNQSGKGMGEVIKRLAESPYGMAIIAAQLKDELKRKCGASKEDMVEVNYCKEEDLSDAFLFWMDKQRSKVREDIFRKNAEDLKRELVPYSFKIIVEVMNQNI